MYTNIYLSIYLFTVTIHTVTNLETEKTPKAREKIYHNGRSIISFGSACLSLEAERTNEQVRAGGAARLLAPLWTCLRRDRPPLLLLLLRVSVAIAVGRSVGRPCSRQAGMINGARNSFLPSSRTMRRHGGHNARNQSLFLPPSLLLAPQAFSLFRSTVLHAAPCSRRSNRNRSRWEEQTAMRGKEEVTETTWQRRLN